MPTLTTHAGGGSGRPGRHLLGRSGERRRPLRGHGSGGVPAVAHSLSPRTPVGHRPARPRRHPSLSPPSLTDNTRSVVAAGHLIHPLAAVRGADPQRPVDDCSHVEGPRAEERQGSCAHQGCHPSAASGGTGGTGVPAVTLARSECARSREFRRSRGPQWWPLSQGPLSDVEVLGTNRPRGALAVRSVHGRDLRAWARTHPDHWFHWTSAPSETICHSFDGCLLR